MDLGRRILQKSSLLAVRLTGLVMLAAGAGSLVTWSGLKAIAGESSGAWMNSFSIFTLRLYSAREMESRSDPSHFTRQFNPMEEAMRTLSISVLTLFALLASSALAQDSPLPQGFASTPLLKSAETASGKPVVYPEQNAEIVAVTADLAPGGQTALHQHPVPVFVYILEGELTVEAEGGEPRLYKAGDAFLEDVNHWHQAFNKTQQPTKILVVFMGEKEKPTTIAKQ